MDEGDATKPGTPQTSTGRLGIEPRPVRRGRAARIDRANAKAADALSLKMHSRCRIGQQVMTTAGGGRARNRGEIWGSRSGFVGGSPRRHRRDTKWTIYTTFSALSTPKTQCSHRYAMN